MFGVRASKPRFFESASHFRLWLARHGARASELLVGFRRKAAGRGLTYREALDEALAFGWIDGVRRRIDEASYSIRFTPRRPGSIWSAVNIARATALEREGRMMPAGLHAFRGRDEGQTRKYSYENEAAALSPDLAARLRANAGAAAFFDAQPPGYRRIATYWIMSAKKSETRQRRLAHLIDRSAAGARIDLLRPAK